MYMTDIINNVFNFINNLFSEINETFKNTDDFGLSFFEDNDVKYYQQLLDPELTPSFIYKGKGYQVQGIKFIPKDLGKFNFETKYKLGSIVKFKGGNFMALAIPNPKKIGDANFTDYVKRIAPTKQFADYQAWKRIVYLDKPIIYDNSKLFPREDVPKEVKEEMILDDSNPKKPIKIVVKNTYNPLTSYKFGDLVKFNEKFYVNLLLKADKQENPSKNKQTWKSVDFKGIMNDSYIPAVKVPSKVFEGEMILPNTEYKGKIKGDFDPEEKYKLGDIVKYKKKYYISLVKGSGFILNAPDKNKKQWKNIKIIKGKRVDDEEDDEKPKKKKGKKSDDDDEEEDDEKPKKKKGMKSDDDDEDDE